MTKRILFLLLFAGLFSSTSDAQEKTTEKTTRTTITTSSSSSSGSSSSVNLISDEMTKDPEQNQQWRMGQFNYSAKPKNAWELGLHAGHFFIDGDVDRTLPGGYGFGLHLRKAVHYVFSIRADFFYGSATGLDPQPWKSDRPVVGAQGSNIDQGGGLVEWGQPNDPDYVNDYQKYNGTQGWFPSHKTRYIYGALQGVINIGNLLFHKDRNKWNWYLALGVGLDNHDVKLDLLDAEGNAYANLVDRTGFNSVNFDTKEGRSSIKSELDNIYDGVYETDGFKKQGIFRLGDDTNIHVVWTGSMGIARKINNRFNIGLEHQIMATDNDYLDGIKFRTTLDQTNNADIGHYTNIRLAINLGNFDKVTEPLYWLNPLNSSFNDIAELKQRPICDYTDSDFDGVVDILDQEIDTQSGCPVDTRGVSLDSDGDGLIDCKDKEPYSPPQYEVDVDGIAITPNYVTEIDVNTIVDGRNEALRKSIISSVVRSGCGEWFLPMIHFDLDKYNVKPEFYAHLHHVATVLKMCPEVCVSVVGHTDIRNSNEYNRVLSYNRSKAAVDYLVTNYGIDRSRFKLMYGGEETPLSMAAGGEKQHYMNRRVEFRVCQPGDYDMERPEGPNAGKGTRSSGSKFSGNKNSGY